MPEEIDIVFRNLQENEGKAEKESVKDKCLNNNSWKAGYIPPYRAAHLNKKEKR